MAFRFCGCQKIVDTIARRMCNIDQLKEAFKNVAYSADPTWTGDTCPFQRASMNLYLKERHIRTKTEKWERLSPRTVRDCIPNSKLALYSNYEYHEARELSYSPMVIKFERLYETFERDEIREPWMLEEIDDLFIAFISYKDDPGSLELKRDSRNLSCDGEVSYESPFMAAYKFDEMALKLRITSQNIKQLWDTKFFPYYGWHPITRDRNLFLFKSPACQFFSSLENELNDNSEWLNKTSDKDETLSQLKVITQNLRKQNNWIFKKQSSSGPWINTHQHDSVDLLPHKRLYSAVLQGTNQNQLQSDRSSTASLQFPPVKSKQESTNTTETANTEIFDECSSDYRFSTSGTSYCEATQVEQANRRVVDINSLGGYLCGSTATHQVYSYYNTRSNVQTTSSMPTPIPSVFSAPTNYTNYQYFPQNNTFLNQRLYPNNFVSNANILNFRQTNYYPLVLQNATAPYAQSSFFNYSRSTFPNYPKPVVFPPRPQVVVPASSGWFLQQPVKIGQPALNLLASRPPIHAPSYNYRCPSTSKPKSSKPPVPSECPTLPKDDFVNKDLESIVAKTVNAVLDDPDPYVPITSTPSDELELQALEQYSASNDNVFQELERQAAEQYETSENWKDPPKCDDVVTYFGGLSAEKVLRLIVCVEEILGLGCSDTIIRTDVTHLVS